VVADPCPMDLASLQHLPLATVQRVPKDPAARLVRMTHCANASPWRPGQCFRYTHSGFGHTAHRNLSLRIR
jgi:hypothetical protein